MRCNSNVSGRSHLKVSVMHHSNAFIPRGSWFLTDAVTRVALSIAIVLIKIKLPATQVMQSKGYSIWLSSVPVSVCLGNGVSYYINQFLWVFAEDPSELRQNKLM